MSAKVAGCAALAGATAQLGHAGRNRGATTGVGDVANSPMTATELRAQLRAQQARNRGATTGLDERAIVAGVAGAQQRILVVSDSHMETRRQRVLAILDANPDFRYAVVTDSDSDPGEVVVHIGVRGVGSGEIVVAKANYDGVELLKALEAA